MSNPNIEREVLTVQELTRYGFKANDRFYNWSKQMNDSQKVAVVPGATLEMEIYNGEKGGKSVNKVFGEASPNKASVTAGVAMSKPSTTPKIETLPEKSGKVLQDSWELKDRRISRQGCIQAAVRAVAPLVAVEDVMKNAETLADAMLEYVNRKDK